MSKKQHLSPDEFDAFMKERHLKRLQNMTKGEKCCIIGCYFDIYFPDNKAVECATCGIPLYVRPWVSEIAQQNNFPIFCQNCVPSKLFKGALVQDLAAAVQHEKEREVG